MMRLFDLRIILLFVIFFCLSCTKTDVENEMSWYKGSSESFQGVKLTQLKINPSHRSGPVSLPQNELSDLPLSIWVPTGAPEPIPLVIYSHGGGSRTNPGMSGESWAQFLSNAGYAVIAMHHMKRSSSDLVENICAHIGVEENNCDPSIYIPYYESTDRPQDAIAVMDMLDEIGVSVGVSFDEDRIAIMGFSGGTNSTHYLAGGVRNAIFGISSDTAFFSINESRPKAFLAMSSGTGAEGGWTAESLASIDAPFLCSTGSSDLSAELRAKFHDQLQGNDQYRIFIPSESAFHGVFNREFVNGADHRANQELFHQWLESVNLAFLDAYVLENVEAKEWLRSTEISQLMQEVLEEDPQFSFWSYR